MPAAAPEPPAAAFWARSASSERPPHARVRCAAPGRGGKDQIIDNFLKNCFLSCERHYSPPPVARPPWAWRASPPALGIAYCTRLPWAPPARWGFPALSGSLALNLGSLPNAGRMSDEVSALVCPSLVMASPGLATMNESSHSQGTPAYLGSLIPPLFPPLSLSEMARALRA